MESLQKMAHKLSEEASKATANQQQGASDDNSQTQDNSVKPDKAQDNKDDIIDAEFHAFNEKK